MHSPDARAAAKPSPASASATPWTPSSRRCAASRSSSPGSRRRRPRPRRRRRSRKAKAAPAKNLAVFTRQFSVMIDAGLPLVQCLEILGNQEEDKNFAAVILQTRADVEGGASLADAMKKHPKTFDALYHQHDCGRRGGRHSRHDSQAAGDLHRKGRQAEGAGQVGDDLSDRGHRHRRRSSSRSFSGRSFRPSPTCLPAWARSCRCRPGSSSRPATSLVRFMPFIIVGGRRGCLRVQALLRHREAAGTSSTASSLKLPVLGPMHAQDCRGAVLPHAVDADGVGRADSRWPRHHGPHRRQRHHRGRHSDDAQEHRARRDDRGAAQADRRVPEHGRADDRRRRSDRRARHDAVARSPTSTKRKSTPRSPAC